MKRPRIGVGDRFGQWVLVRFVGGLRWRAECGNCEDEFNVNVEDLTSGRSTQCYRCQPKEVLPEPEPEQVGPKEILPRAGTPMYTHNGRTMTIPEWCRATGIKPVTLRQRLARGWSFADAVSVNNARGRRSYRSKEG